ncbi:MAG TPA: methyltransferase [Flavisolibacter sp.]|nr:methyltransferase [Flavisolibacter sp.]
MANSYFKFKQFTVHQHANAMKVATDSCLFGAWVANEIQINKSKSEVELRTKLLDIGTGTALLSLMIVQKNNVQIDAVEIDKDAAEEAKQNVETSQWNNKIKVHHSNILSYPFPYVYHYIVCNPPFYENELKSNTSGKNRAYHSMQLTIQQVLQLIKKNLKPEGAFYLLIPGKRESEVEKLMKDLTMYPAKKVLVHLSATNKRYMIQGVLQRADETEREEITVNDEKFKTLLKDYYLNA